MWKLKAEGKIKVNKMIQIYVTNYICNWWMKSAYIDKVVVKVCIDMHGVCIHNFKIIVFLSH